MNTHAQIADEHQGYEDAMNGFPRESTRPFYRKGYDRGITDALEDGFAERNRDYGHEGRDPNKAEDERL